MKYRSPLARATCFLRLEFKIYTECHIHNKNGCLTEV